MASEHSSPGLTRLNGILGFFIGIFGAMAILGVFFKILKLPHFEIFMVIGFVGEAAAFVVMGIFALVGSFSARKYERLEDEHRRALDADAQLSVRATVHKLLDKQISNEVNQMMAALSQEIGRFGSEIQQVGGELERTRHAVLSMRQELDRVASGDLAGDAERLGRGMQVLGSEMTEAGDSVERIRSDLEEMAQRFRHFNAPLPPGDVAGTKIRRLP